MANLLLGHPVYSDPSVLFTPTFSGGSWLAALPLTNLQDRRLWRVARSTNATAANTQFDIDLKASRVVGCVALPKSNIGLTGTVRVRGYTTTGHVGNVYDSGTITFGPAGLTAETVGGLNVAFAVFPANIAMQFVFVEVTDTGNPAGFIDLARLIVAGAYQPTINMSWGATLGLETATTRVEMDGGAAAFNERPMRRVLTGVLEQIPEAEAFASYWRILKQAGISKQLFVAWDPGDTTLKHDRQFLAVFKTPSALKAPYLARHEGAFSFVEEL